MNLALSNEQVGELHLLLDAVLSDLSYEIAGTDNAEYRSKLRHRRQLLTSIRGELEISCPTQ